MLPLFRVRTFVQLLGVWPHSRAPLSRKPVGDSLVRFQKRIYRLLWGKLTAAFEADGKGKGYEGVEEVESSELKSTQDNPGPGLVS